MLLTGFYFSFFFENMSVFVFGGLMIVRTAVIGYWLFSIYYYYYYSHNVVFG